MDQHRPLRSPDSDAPTGDPWQAFAYLLTGVVFYGGLGWLADRWLHTTGLVGVGIVVGAGLGIYLTWKRFATTTPQDQQ